MEEIFICFDCLTPFSFGKDISEINPREWSIKKNICKVCVEKLFYKKKQEIENNNTPRLKNLYQNRLKQLIENDNLPPVDPLKEQRLDTEIEELKNNELLLSKEVNQLEKDITNLINQHSILLNRHSVLMKETSELEHETFVKENQLHHINNYKAIYSDYISQFTSTHILSDLFVITISSKIATINGKRIGERILDAKDIRDNETNSGLGYILLLTAILSYKFGFVSSRYELITGTNLSLIKAKGNEMMYELTIPSGVKTFEKFNEAAKVFLEYFAEFYEYLIKTKLIIINKNDFQFNIVKDCINGKSINLDINKLQNWNQCMKLLLTELKFLLTQVIKNEDNKYKNIIDKKGEFMNLNNSNNTA